MPGEQIRTRPASQKLWLATPAAAALAPTAAAAAAATAAMAGFAALLGNFALLFLAHRGESARRTTSTLGHNNSYQLG